MRACTEAMRQHLAGEVTRLATLWRIERRDGVVMGFTDHDCDLVCLGTTYRAASGFTPTAVASTAGMAVDNLEVQSVLDSDDIGEADLMAGVYDQASVEVFLVDHAAPEQGRLFMRKGVLGEVRTSDAGFVAEVRGLADAFAHGIGQIYAPTCRAELGDGRCRVGLRPFTVAGQVASASDRRSFTDPARTEAADWFRHGVLTWTSGANAGAAMEVRSFRDGGFVLFLPMAHDIAAGDGYAVHAGCDKLFATCRERFANAINFQGEPHVPGLDFLFAPAGR